MKNEDVDKIEEQDSEILDFNNPTYSFTPQGRHSYRQEGPYLICKSCEIKHAIYIGPDKIMVGEDSGGSPILKTKKELGFL